MARHGSEIKDLSITVAGNTGSDTFFVLGHLRRISVKAPAGNSTFDYDISDANGHGLTGKTGNTGNTTVSVDLPCTHSNTFTLSNAVNGAYTIRLTFDSGI